MKRLLTILLLAALAFVPGCDLVTWDLSQVPTSDLLDELGHREDFLDEVPMPSLDNVRCWVLGDCEE